MANEKRAFEGLVLRSLRKMETDDVDLCSIREATNEQKETLNRIRKSGFLKKLFSGEITAEQEPSSTDCRQEELACARAGGSLFRSDDIDEETARELDEADQEIIDRKTRRQEDADG